MSNGISIQYQSINFVGGPFTSFHIWIHLFHSYSQSITEVVSNNFTIGINGSDIMSVHWVFKELVIKYYQIRYFIIFCSRYVLLRFILLFLYLSKWQYQTIWTNWCPNKLFNIHYATVLIVKISATKTGDQAFNAVLAPSNLEQSNYIL